MKSQSIKFNPLAGQITLFDRNLASEIRGSMMLVPQHHGLTDRFDEIYLSGNETIRNGLRKVIEITQNISQKIWEYAHKINDFFTVPTDTVVDFFQVKLSKLWQSLAILTTIVGILGIAYLLVPLLVLQLELYSREQTIAAKKVEVPVVEGLTGISPNQSVVSFNELAQPLNYRPTPLVGFNISIPKIEISSKVMENVDPSVKGEYLDALQHGVAHAYGSYFPGEDGPVVLFAHSTDTVQNITFFNAQFYAAKDLVEGDEIYITKDSKEYRYIVESKIVIDPKETQHIQESDKDLILVTCYPPGTDWQRLVVFAKLAPPKI